MGDRAVSALRFAVAAGLCVIVAGCEAYKIGNPFLPKAKILASADDPKTEVTISPPGRDQVWASKTQPETMKFTLRPFPGDITPGVRINSYTIDWFDINGSAIPGNSIPARTQGISVYLEKGSGATTGGAPVGGGANTAKTIEIPVVTNPVIGFGIQNGFIFDSTSDTYLVRTDGWSQYLSGRVTFSGRDDNGYPVDNVSAYFTLKFTTQSSGSVN